MEMASGTTIRKKLSELLVTQWWSREQLEALQQKKLRALIKHAYQNVPYYHTLFKNLKISPDDIKTTDDLKKIPVLTKKDIRINFLSLQAKNFSPSQRIESYSSGSTGEPLRYFIDKSAYSSRWAQTFRCWSWAGYHLGDPYVKLSSEARSTVYKKIQDRLFNSWNVNYPDIPEENFVQFAQKIKKIKPVIIRSYPTLLYTFSKRLRNINFVYDGAAVTTTGSILYPHYREAIEKQFNCKIFDAYGGEGTPVSFECEEHCGYHMADEDVIVEFLRGTEPAAPGEISRIVFTNLNNYSMPFIRYDIQDLGSYSEDQCSCGRGLSVMKSIHGRDADILVTPSGKFILAHFFGIIFRDIPGVEQFQVIQNKIDAVTIKIVKNFNFSEKNFAFITKEIQKQLGDDVDLHIDFVEEIPLSGRSGKRRYVISDIPLGL